MGLSRLRFTPRKFEMCPDWGANLSPLLSTHPLLNTPVAGLRPSHGCFQSLPVLTQIYPNFPSQSPQFPPSGAPATRRVMRGGI